MFRLRRHLQLLVHQTSRSFPARVYSYSFSPKHRRDNLVKMLTLSVDGNISSGKSTLVSKLVDFFPHGPGASTSNGQVQAQPKEPSKMSEIKVEVIPEPLEKWCNLQGYNLLEMFYSSPEKNNFLFQHYVQLTRLMDTVRGNPEFRDAQGKSGAGDINIRLMERSLQNNRYCFLEIAQRSGKLHPAEFAVLKEWYEWLEKNMNLKLDLIIYLRTKPETAYARMKSRAREAEECCSFQYLVDLHESYEDWLIRKNGENPNSLKQHVIVLDAEQSREEVAAQCFNSLRDYLTSLTNKCVSSSVGSGSQANNSVEV